MPATHALDDEAGFIGKFIIVWLLVLALLGLAAVDATSILFTRFRLDDAAATAASAGATTFQNDGRDATQACAAAQASVKAADPNAEMGKAWCKVDTSTGEVTVTLHKTANTLVTGRLAFTKDLAKVEERETAGPSAI